MAYIEVVNCPISLKSNRYLLREGTNLLGREKGSDVEIPDPKISARHAILMVKGENVEFIDQNSTNGILLNKVRTRKARWQPETRLVMGGTEMVLKSGSFDKPQAVSRSGSKFNLDNFMGDFTIVREMKIDTLAVDPDESLSMNPENFAKRIKVINRLVKSLNRTLQVPDLLDRVMLLLFEVVQCDRGYILLTDPDNHEIIKNHLAYQFGVRNEKLDNSLYSRTLVSTVLRNRSGFIFDQDDSDVKDPSLSIFRLHIQTALCCPIHSEGSVFGVIYLDSKKSESKFNVDDLYLTMNVAGIAGVAIENVQLLRKLETETMIRDHLKRFLSPNIADKIIAERGGGDFHLRSQKASISVLFADIRGFTPLSEALSPLEVAQLLNTYFSEMATIVFANGGTLDKFIGDCMMVLFNVPVAVPDHEYVAVKTALEIRQRLRQVLPEWKEKGIPDFQIGIGVNSGEAVVGSIGTSVRMEYTAIGDTVNIASRICGIAKADQILITENVFTKIGKRFRSVRMGDTQLKGKTCQVMVHEIIDDAVCHSTG